MLQHGILIQLIVVNDFAILIHKIKLLGQIQVIILLAYNVT